MASEEHLIKWIADIRELHGNLWDKALKFVDYNCIHYISDKHDFIGEGRAYIVLPLNTSDKWVFNNWVFNKKPYSINYNKTAYVITVSYERELYALDKDGNYYHCSCQGWKSKFNIGGDIKGINCFHTLALKAYFKRNSFERRLYI